MVGWKRHLQILKFCQFGKKAAAFSHNNINNGSFANFSTYHHLRPSSLLVPGELPCLQSLRTQPPLTIPRPFYQYLQHLRFSGTRNLLTDSSDATPIPSPLSPVLALESGKKAEDQKVVSKPAKVQAVLKGIKQSPKKVNLVAELIRGMRVEDALLQLQVAVKRAAKTVYQVIHSARANATHNHGLDADRLLVAEAHVGKGLFKKRINYHAKGKCGMKVRPECRLTVVVREITAEEEAEIAKLKVHNFRKLSKRERRLVPHKLIETTPVWGRKSKGREPAGTAA